MPRTRDPNFVTGHLCRFCGKLVPWGAILRLIRVDPDTPGYMLNESACHTDCLRKLLRPEVELTEYGSNQTLLKQVAEFTGGRFEPAPKAVFDAGGRTLASTLQLWPGLLGLAVLANLAELLLRKWKGLFGRS